MQPSAKRQYARVRQEHGLEAEVPTFLEIAAIGTVADVMKLTGENRAIVALGLLDLTKTNNIGLRALMNVSDCRSDMTSYHIGFRIGPRIKEAGFGRATDDEQDVQGVLGGGLVGRSSARRHGRYVPMPVRRLRSSPVQVRPRCDG